MQRSTWSAWWVGWTSLGARTAHHHHCPPRLSCRTWQTGIPRISDPFLLLEATPSFPSTGGSWVCPSSLPSWPRRLSRKKEQCSGSTLATRINWKVSLLCYSWGIPHTSHWRSIPQLWLPSCLHLSWRRVCPLRPSDPRPSSRGSRTLSGVSSVTWLLIEGPTGSWGKPWALAPLNPHRRRRHHRPCTLHGLKISIFMTSYQSYALVAYKSPWLSTGHKLWPASLTASSTME